MHGINGLRGFGGQVIGTSLLWVMLALPQGGQAEYNTDYIVNGTVSNVSSLNLPASSPGTNNSLQIINGGTLGVTNGDLMIGPAFGDEYNRVLVDGTGSSLLVTGPTFTTLWVGEDGARNQLIVTNGGQVIGQALHGRIIIGYLAPSNSVTVSGPTSVMTFTNSASFGNINLGWSAGFNQLTIDNGGRINSSLANVGAIAAGGLSNVAVVTGAGSIWSNSSTFAFGMGSAGNQLIISDGGRVDVGGDFNSYNGLANNSVLVTGTNSLLSLPNSDIFLSGDNMRMTIANAGRVVNRSAYIGYTANTNNVVIVTDPGSLWSNTTSINMGYPAASGTRLIVTNGGQVTSPTLILGAFAAGTSNTVVTVTGSNSTINLTGALTVGGVSASNTLQVLDGGRVRNGIGTIGSGVGASNNLVLVSGPGSVWTNTGTINVGFNAGGNQLTIANGGRVDSADASVGSASSITPDNRALVTGSNSLWSMAGGLGIGGHNAQVTIADGGSISSLESYIGNGNSTSTNVSVLITGSGSTWGLSGDMNAGYLASGTTLTLTNGGRVNSNRGFIGRNSPTSNNLVVVTGSGSLWNITNDLFMSLAGNGNNQLQILDGGRVKNASAHIGGSATNNVVLVSGAGSVWSNTGSINVGTTFGGNHIVITNGGRVDSGEASIGTSSGVTDNNSALVTGSNSLWSLPGFGLGVGGHNGRLTILDGGRVNSSDGYIGNGGVTASNVVVLVSGVGSTWSNSASLNVGYNSAGSKLLVITNGGHVDVGQSFVGRFAAATNNTAIVTGDGSQWNHTLMLWVGSNTIGQGAGSVLVEDGGLIESTGLISGLNGSGTISNRQGIYQFTTAAPTVTTNTAGSIVITNGTISYRDVNGANIHDGEVAHMTFQGNNAFRLNNSTNSSVAAYTFDSVANTGTPTNYQTLALVNGGSRWVGTTLTVGTGGAMLVSNATAASVSAVVTNLGSITVVNSKMTFEGRLVINGSYVSDPSTNTYLADVTVNPSGSLAGGVGDLFDFKQSLYIHSTNRTGFDLSSSTVQFSGGGVHTNAITGADLGGSNVAFDASFASKTNFAYGTLRLGSTNDIVCFECGNLPVVASNALYIGFLDLTGLTNDIPSINTLVTSLLHAPTNINLYYQFGGNNAYLGGLTYQLTDCNDQLGGFLMPVIPEPSAAVLLTVAAGLFMRRRQERNG